MYNNSTSYTSKSNTPQIETIVDPVLCNPAALPSDTQLSLSVALNSFPRLKFPKTPPIVLVSQLYSSVKDRTDVDKELDQLKRNGQIRVFKFLSDKNDYAIVMYSDFLNQIQTLKHENANNPENCDIFDRYVNNVLPRYTDVHITKDMLLKLMFVDEPINDNAITLLVNSGLLLLHEVDSYWFSIPRAASFIKSLVRGRKEILSILKRQKFKEMLLSELEKRRLRYSILNISFHVKDLIELGSIESVPTLISGPLIRVIQF
jgi:serine/threonine-protein kinase 19